MAKSMLYLLASVAISLGCLWATTDTGNHRLSRLRLPTSLRRALVAIASGLLLLLFLDDIRSALAEWGLPVGPLRLARILLDFPGAAFLLLAANLVILIPSTVGFMREYRRLVLKRRPRHEETESDVSLGVTLLSLSLAVTSLQGFIFRDFDPPSTQLPITALLMLVLFQLVLARSAAETGIRTRLATVGAHPYLAQRLGNAQLLLLGFLLLQNMITKAAIIAAAIPASARWLARHADQLRSVTPRETDADAGRFVQRLAAGVQGDSRAKLLTFLLLCTSGIPSLVLWQLLSAATYPSENALAHPLTLDLLRTVTMVILLWALSSHRARRTALGLTSAIYLASWYLLPFMLPSLFVPLSAGVFKGQGITFYAALVGLAALAHSFAFVGTWLDEQRAIAFEKMIEALSTTSLRRALRASVMYDSFVWLVLVLMGTLVVVISTFATLLLEGRVAALDRNVVIPPVAGGLAVVVVGFFAAFATGLASRGAGARSRRLLATRSLRETVGRTFGRRGLRLLLRSSRAASWFGSGRLLRRPDPVAFAYVIAALCFATAGLLLLVRLCVVWIAASS